MISISMGMTSQDSRPSPDPQPESRPHAARRAAAEAWFARLRSPDCGLRERNEFRAWSALPENAAAYAATQRAWDELGALSADADMQQLMAQVLDASAPRRRPRFPRRGLQALAASVLAVVAFALLKSGYPAPPAPVPVATQIHTTALGETRTLTLDDGSRLTLNADTEVDTRFSRGVRDLALVRGEALFDVHHDQARPFIVDAGSGAVTALGTRFLVRRQAGAVTVTLLQGRVAVDRAAGADHTTLEPGEQLSFEADGAAQRRRVDVDTVAAWTRGRLIFRSTPLSAALDEVNRYSVTQIRLADASLAATPVSGTLRVGDGKAMANALAAMLPLQVQPEAGGEIVLIRR